MKTISASARGSNPAAPALNEQGKKDKPDFHTVVDATALGRTTPLIPLAEVDLLYLLEREAIITGAVKSALAASKALYEICSYQDGSLWKESHSSFQHYCSEKWGYGKSHSYRLLDTGRLIADVGAAQSPRGENIKPPVNEAQVRTLVATVPRERQVECWCQIVADKDPALLTSTVVKAEVKKYLKSNDLLPERRKKAAKTAKQGHETAALDILNKLRGALGKLPDPARFDIPLATLEMLIRGAARERGGDIDITVAGPFEPGTPHRLGQDSPPCRNTRALERGVASQGRLTSDVHRESAFLTITPEIVADAMAGDDADHAFAEAQTSSEDPCPAAAADRSDTTAPPPAREDGADAETSPDQEVKMKAAPPGIQKRGCKQKDEIPELPGTDSTTLDFTGEAPKKVWWVKEITANASDPEGTTAFEYQLMNGDEPNGNPAPGEVARSKFTAHAGKLNRMANAAEKMEHNSCQADADTPSPSYRQNASRKDNSVSFPKLGELRES